MTESAHTTADRLEIALGDTQRQERREMEEDIERQQRADDRIVDALSSSRQRT